MELFIAGVSLTLIVVFIVFIRRSVKKVSLLHQSVQLSKEEIQAGHTLSQELTKKRTEALIKGSSRLQGILDDVIMSSTLEENDSMLINIIKHEADDLVHDCQAWYYSQYGSHFPIDKNIVYCKGDIITFPSFRSN